MKICFIRGVRNGERLKLSGDRFRIGRETDNDIVLETEGVSRYHAELIKDGGDWILKDLGSTNGCKVNDQTVDGEKTLAEGDLVALGDQEFRIGDEKNEPEVRAADPVIPVIQSMKTEPETPGGKGGKTGAETVVRKIVFQPMPKKAGNAGREGKSKDSPEPVIETVKPAAQKAKPEPAAEKTKDETMKSPLITAKELSESAADIFDMKKKTPEKESKKPEPAIRKHLFNIIFYLVLLFGVVVFVFWFLSYNQETGRTSVAAVKKVREIPLLLYYVKTKITQDNVFRFSLLVENNSAQFVIDDLKSNRHHSETIKEIKPEFMKTLKTAIESTGFMDLQPVSRGAAVNNLDETREMTIALNDKLNTVTIRNNSAPTSFEGIEDAIMEFADGYELLTFAMPPKELQKRAQESFDKAEEYYANRNANASNLLAAERRYKITIDYLNQFSPKPKIWDIARKRHAEVSAMRHKRWNELQYEVERLERLAKIKEAIETLNEMLELAPEGSKAYKWARLKITRLSEALKARKR
ncbi:MAG: FHA domain-containing protein [Victivallaceae bacterium]|nr:FHA domain-containing protein [Victivallaceae bacterium]